MPDLSALVLPPQVKITLPEINISGCEDGHLLAGDYILERLGSRVTSAGWALRFEPVCGFAWMSLRLNVLEDGSWKMTLVLFGKNRHVVWESTGKKKPSLKKVLRFLSSSDEATSWPTRLKVTRLSAPESVSAAKTVPVAGSTSSSMVGEAARAV